MIHVTLKTGQTDVLRTKSNSHRRNYLQAGTDASRLGLSCCFAQSPFALPKWSGDSRKKRSVSSVRLLFAAEADAAEASKRRFHVPVFLHEVGAT